VAVLTLLFAYLPLNTVFEFVPLPFPILLSLLVITGFYVLATEMVKRAFYEDRVK
jgi:hypothetical protein